MIKVIEFKEFDWGFNSNHPSFRYEISDGKYIHESEFDPFPCYSHDTSLIETLSNNVFLKFPIHFDVYYCLFAYEPIQRTNGQASYKSIYDEKLKVNDRYPFIGIISLFGKRIPLMPAMSRYLVGHEYGHIVDY